MSSKPISQLQELSTITGEELLPVVTQGKTKRIALNKIKQIIKKEDIGLGNVDNTSDLDKPVSRAQQSALNDKADRVHEHPLGEVRGLPEALAMLAEKQHSHVPDDIVNLEETILNVIQDANVDLSGVVRSGDMQW
jgi:hypothetical protein